jgi:uncharacterized protein YicC (UPF0701 family)
MTGFGRSSFDWEGTEYRVEIKSLNGKLLDLQIKTSEPWSGLDSNAHKLLQQHLVRGKVALQVWSVPRSSSGSPSEVEPNIHINPGVLETLRKQWNELPGEFKGPRAEELLSKLIAAHPMIFARTHAENSGKDQRWIADPIENNRAAVEVYQNALELALKDCVKYRLTEGGAIKAALQQYLQEILWASTEIQKIDAAKEPLIRKKIDDFWAEWNGRKEGDPAHSLSPDPIRLEQELLYYLEKKDIAEELVRLRQHMAFANEILENHEEQGRKLGFVAQEIGRELNTIGSKASDFEIQRRIVLAKEILEKIKEQTLNLL